MNYLDVISFFGGLALFLYGMQVMGAGLEKQAGGTLKHTLEKLTSNPVKGVLLGAGVTAIIQSSSATTVMVMGFVNSGLMDLHQTVGVIMGAKIGTTATAWLLSLADIPGGSVFFELLNPSSLAPILAFAGILLYMAGKQEKRKNIGVILLGFAILLFGMTTMSGAVSGLAQVPGFTRILTLFNNPILGLLAGVLLTAVIQSSSASVGILQALSVSGSVSLGMAVPIIAGQNIGACVTSMISAIGANKDAKRTAMINLYFSVIGAVVFLVLFYGAGAALQFAMEAEVSAVAIAIIHTAFNVVSTLVLLPFTGQLEKLAKLSIRGDKVEEKTSMLDERLMITPSVALGECRKLAAEMAGLARVSLADSLALTQQYSSKKAAEIQETENQLDLFEDKLGTYLVKLSSHELALSDSHEVSKLLHVIGDFERIGDHAVNMLKTAEEIHDKKLQFSEDAMEELQVLYGAVNEVLGLAVEAFVASDLEKAALVEPLEQVVDLLQKKLKNRHVERLQKGECTIEMGFVFSDILTNCERVADHCSNIAVCMIQVAKDSFDTHEYLSLVKGANGALPRQEFARNFESYKEKYAYPHRKGAHTQKHAAHGQRG